MLKFFHAISTGTSILQNFLKKKEYKNIVEKYKMEDWYKLSPNDKKQKIIESCIPRKNEVHESLINFVKKDPKSASSELNSFLSFIEHEKQRKEDIEIMLYSTDTNNNRLCAEIVKEYLEEMNFRIVGEVVKVRDFGVGIEKFESGLVEIFEKVIRIISSKSKQKYEIYINATAGYKPETTFVILAAMLCSIKSPVIYYIHEAFRTPISLPILPIKVEDDYIEIAEKFKTPVPQNIALEELKKHGLSLEELERKKILTINTEKNLVQTREWLRKLIEIMKHS